MFSIKIEGMAAFQKELSALSKNTPLKAAKALTEIAVKLKTHLVQKMKTVFDRPTPFTLNSLWVDMARPQKLEAAVYFREFAGKGTAAGKYLKPQVHGGPRPHKRFEKALIAKRLMPNYSYAVPGHEVKLDKYGNIPGALIVKILSALGGFSEVGYSANRPVGAKRKGQKDFFAVLTRRGRLAPGIWERDAKGKVKSIMIYLPRAPHYKPRFPFFKWSQSFVAEHSEKILRDRLRVEK